MPDLKVFTIANNMLIEALKLQDFPEDEILKALKFLRTSNPDTIARLSELLNKVNW